MFTKAVLRCTLVTALFFVACKQQPKTTEKPPETKALLTDWPVFEPQPLDSTIEAQIDSLLPQLTLEQKVGQIIQADSESVTPEEVKQYRLGSVLSGGNSAPGDKAYADAKTWLQMADQYYNASMDTDGVEVAIPIIWGIDAVHGHGNLEGAIILPHNIGLGATHNPELIQQLASITAHELTVSGHDWTFAPTLAVPQDVRWGRSYEGFSEEPDLANRYADKIVLGLQGTKGDADFMGAGRVISCAKHFLADGATENGVDQGDAKIDESELLNVHAAGYYSAIPAGVQTVMASFSSYNGRKLHGDYELLTEVLKGKLGFNGFVVGDWNGHGQVPDCTNEDCPNAFNAGVDMFMAPDSWKGLYESTLKHVKAGTITMERLDDAVRRILRVKLASGIFDKGAPSTRKFAGDERQLALPEHRALARQAVRESMVLLKNNEQVLPIDASKTILVVGDGAEHIIKAAGGWSLSWQGEGHTNAEFPNGESILEGIKEAVAEKGGKLIFSPEADASLTADVVIAVYGEDPYAEFQGDRKHLDFVPNAFDTAKLSAYKEKGIPVVSVFLSGRPMWTNPELNLSDAFVAAWLPGSEGGGVSDLLFKRDAAYDFTGKLSFSWPATAVAPQTKDVLFKLGYGLNYSSKETVEVLPENSDLENLEVASTGVFFDKGQPTAPWRLQLQSADLEKQVASFPTSIGGLLVGKTDHMAQEDALKLEWTSTERIQAQLIATTPADMARESNGAMELAFYARTFDQETATVQIGVCSAAGLCNQQLEVVISGQAWKEYRLSLSCFEKLGTDMTAVNTAFSISAPKGTTLGLSAIQLATDADAKPGCDGK
ncbi:glycoside hydrolase family 3 protein [Croceivirga sp. JEA036]|uniref:glycoside hydrolase family 3 protein n=1 Tax=Croceivirga sp. JEA036 TaxID=2721162 RepID=UPI001439221E|nr:glycoside hydrolase family 3 protein [Croceivirga sp. JEA036]NJB35277.1 glycoside hydrolase family 3 protein [Croceivirga sp. JEA036]